MTATLSRLDVPVAAGWWQRGAVPRGIPALMTTVAFTSCAKIQAVKKQKVWDEIAEREPDALLLLGDNVYMKREDHDDPAQLADDLDRHWLRQLAEPHFAALLGQLKGRGAAVLASWDDHDAFGDDRCGGDIDPALVAAARAVFHRRAPVTHTAPELYCRADIGDATVLMLDARSFRSATDAKSDRDGMLGAAQWRWLEAQLASPRQRYTLVCNGSPLHDYRSEGWLAWPAARERLVESLRDRPGVLFLGGDVHDNEIGQADGVVEVVSSGIARISKVMRWKLGNYGVLELKPEGVRVKLRGRQPKQRRNVWIPLDDWRVPKNERTNRDR
jgi:phosphodiesterase/alkaline phosphatase D-like protein